MCKGRKAADSRAGAGERANASDWRGYLCGHGCFKSHRGFHYCDNGSYFACEWEDRYSKRGGCCGSTAANRRQVCLLALQSGNCWHRVVVLARAAGSAAYAVGEVFRWRTSLESKPHRARKFYLSLAVIMLAGLSLNCIRIDPIRALVWSAVINAIAAPP